MSQLAGALSPFSAVRSPSRLATCSRAQSKGKRKAWKKRDGRSDGVGGGSSEGFGGAGKMKELQWQCVKGCGACCKLAKGPSFATLEEIFDNPSDIQLYRSLIGSDGWCKHFDKNTRTCSIYADRPYFCHVQPDIFQTLYGIDERKFNKEACSFCKDTIKATYGPRSEELHSFNSTLLATHRVNHFGKLHFLGEVVRDRSLYVDKSFD
ncbi:hypothetical protein Dimus_003021 [Dionaea muscipula]